MVHTTLPLSAVRLCAPVFAAALQQPVVQQETSNCTTMTHSALAVCNSGRFCPKRTAPSLAAKVCLQIHA